MRKIAAFAATFILTLIVTLVPIAVSDLASHDTPSSVEAQQAAAPADIGATATYEYFVWPAVQEAVADTYLYLRSGKDKMGDYIDDDDNGGKWDNARISTDLDEEKWHTIEATTKLHGQTGDFEIMLCRWFDGRDSLRSCKNPILDLSTEGCTTDLGMLSNNVRIKGTWEEHCHSEGRTGSYARYYTFAWSIESGFAPHPPFLFPQPVSASTVIDLRGQPNIKRNPRKLDMSCGWHKVCVKDVATHSELTGVDIAEVEPVFFAVSNSEGSAPIKAQPEYLTSTNEGCKKVEINIVTLGSNPRTLWTLLYTHVVIPKTPAGPLPDIPISSTDDIFTIRQIGKVALAPKEGQSGSDYDNSNCPNTGHHLHQGYSHAHTAGVTRNIDPDTDTDTDRTDLCVTDSVDDEGLPTRKLFKTQIDGVCRDVVIHGQTVDNGVPMNRKNDMQTDVDVTSCLWSDVWVIAFGTTSPKPSDRSIYGPNRYQIGEYKKVKYRGQPQQASYCPLRFIPSTFPDQLWADGREILLQLPEAQGGDGTVSYAIDCAGLSFDESTRTLSGTPNGARVGTCTLKATDTLEATAWKPGLEAEQMTTELTFSYTMVSGILPISDATAPPTRLRLSAGSDRLNLSFTSSTSSRSAEFELYQADGGIFCTPGDECSADGTASASASAASVHFGKQSSGVYRARGRSCAASDVIGVSAAGADGASGSADSTSCSEWSAWSPEFTHRVPSFGSKTVSAQSWTRGTAVSLTLPEASGGDGTLRYSLTTPPGGTTLNRVTRVLSGAPSATQTAETYTWTATDDDGDTASLTFTIAVSNPVPTYKLTINVSPSDCASASGAGDYISGARVSISATANSGCRFKDWSGSGIANTSLASTTVTMGSAAKTITANFTKQCTLTMSVASGGGGTTTPAAGSTHVYNPCRSSVDLSASPNTGYRFESWSGDISGTSASASVSLQAGDAKTVTATFEATYKLTIDVSPSDCGSASGDGDYVASKVVSISAMANSGCRFKDWSGSGIANTSLASTTVTMGSAAKTITANFTKQCTLTMSVASGGGGTTTPAAGSTHVYNPCRSSVDLSASPNTGYRFESWSGDISGTSASASVSLQAGDAKTVTATFEATYKLTIDVSPRDCGSASGAGDVVASEVVSISASANSGCRFDRWSGSGIANTTAASTTVTMGSGAKRITARFDKKQQLTIRVMPSSCGSTGGGGKYYEDERVSISASANSGCRFRYWIGDDIANRYDASTTVTMSSGAKTITARFVERYKLTVNASPASCGTTSGSGTYDKGYRATVTVRWNSGCRFTGWSSKVTNVRTYSRTRYSSGKVVVTSTMTVTAGFVEQYRLTLRASPAGGGSVSASPAGPVYDKGTVVTLTASPARLHYLSSWSGATATGTLNQARVTVRAATTVTANFRYVCNDHSHAGFGPCVGGGGEPDAPP